ncbi:hypothetical protein [Roseomonas haemaphysalidis]|uniref:Uncharacterized protein n=1 Tax=Roseomonas haemaphysalidis TaxID=2768162 RepID=A0ABS3KNN1_9PROT|nr:hypothetical protein [Roseomonas haemaphysalidis]MBO1079075.1 hypothetical protein [Roseomonas haemaphysalidis]
MSILNINLALENAGARLLESGVTTFAEVFAKGELAAGSGLNATIGGATSAVQLDVKTTYDDGSVKMAVLSVLRPDLAAGQSLDVTLATAAPSSAAAINLSQALAGHAFTVDIAGSGGNHGVDVLHMLQDALANGTASVWQTGALASQARVEIPLDGSQRLVFDVTAFQGGGLKIDAQFNNDGAMLANGGHAAYHVTATLDGDVVMRENVNQGQYQNWHETFSTTDHDGGQGLGDSGSGWLNIRHDVAHLQATGAVAQYDLSIGISEAKLAGWGLAASLFDFADPLSAHGVLQYMPNTGGRDDIGFTTASNTAWLMSQDPRAAAYAMGQAEAGSVIPWHQWDNANGGWLSAEDYPRLWTDGRGGTGTPGNSQTTGLTQQIGKPDGWTLDSAHQPDLSYVPYLLTGERWMLDNLQAQGAWNVLNIWNDTRGEDGFIVVNGGQVRHSAWALRQIDEAAWASPDGSAEKSYFTAVSKANWAWLVDQIPAWTAAQGEAHGWVPGDYGADNALPPWQQDYFASTAIAAASHGNADALTFLQWQSNFLVGRFTHEAQGFAEHDGAAYLIAIGDPATGKPLQTWGEIGAQTVAWNWSNGSGWAHSDGDYAQLAMATLAGIAHLTGSPEAIAAYNALAADAPPFVNDATFSKDPTFAIAAPSPSDIPVLPGGNLPPTQPVPEPTPEPVPTPDPVPTHPTPAPDPVPEHPVPTPDPVPSHPDPTPDPVPTPTPTPTPTPDPVPEQPAPDSVASLSMKVGTFGFVGGAPDVVITVDGVQMFHGAIGDGSATVSEVVLGQVTADTDHHVLLSFPEQGEPGGVLYVADILMDGVSAGTGVALMGHGEANLTAHGSGDIFGL